MNSLLLWIEAHRAFTTAATSIVVTLLTLGGGFFVGQKLTARWNVRVKEREADLAAIQRVRELYGQLLSARRSWDCHQTSISMGVDERRLQLLDKVSDAEGELEGTIMKIAHEHDLSQTEIDQLGLVRQAYQQPRECIREASKIPWNRSEQPQYQVLKLGTQAIINILSRERSLNVPLGQFEKITSNEYEVFKEVSRLKAFLAEKKTFAR
jgi:hypothetical protein